MATRIHLYHEYKRLLAELPYSPPDLEYWIKTYSNLKQDYIKATDREGIVFQKSLDNKGKNLILPGGFLDQTVPINVLIQPLAEEIERSAPEWNLSLQFPVYCAVFPTGEFNAVATPAGEGALLLINEGLMYLAYQCMEIWGLCCSIPSDGENGPGLHPKISGEQAIEALAKVIAAYLSKGSSALAPQYPTTGGIRGLYIDMLATSIHRFVVAHEYGHAYSGHLTHRPTKTLSVRGNELSIISKNWEKEYKADLVVQKRGHSTLFYVFRTSRGRDPFFRSSRHTNFLPIVPQ